MMAKSSASPVWTPATLDMRDERMRLAVGQLELSAPIARFANGDRNGFATLAGLAVAAGKDGITLRCCASCEHFAFSGLSFQFSGGSRGYCELAGGREPDAEVDIGFGCGEHEPIAGWPDDLAAMDQTRMKLRMRRAVVSRSPAFAGAILGLAVGDAQRSPGEFSGSESARLVLATAEAVLTARDAEIDSNVHEVAERLAKGMSRDTSAPPESTGALPAIQVVPIGLRLWRNPEQSAELARASVRLLGSHEAEVESAAAVALLVALAMRKRTPEEMYRAVLETCGSRSAELGAQLRRLRDVLGSDPDVALSTGGLSDGSPAQQAVAGALYCFWRSPEDYRATMLTAATATAVPNAIGCIAGAVAGAFNGVESIPQEWRARVAAADAAESIAERLWHQVSGGTS
jgi:ADP-ribosylglycohydrolase